VRRTVGTQRPDDLIERSYRVVVDRPAIESDVIVVAADRHVFAAQRRIAARDDRDDVARRAERHHRVADANVRHRLEVAAVFAGGTESELLKLRGHVVGGLDVPDRAGFAPHHGVVGERGEARLEVARRDGGGCGDRSGRGGRA
jgi:hypothetical protein